MEVFLANIEQLEEVSNLFDRYRSFYEQPTDLQAATKFIQSRFHNNDSTIFVAKDNGLSIGFIQLYPSFSSVSMKKIWILNDLFVEEKSRHKGAAKLLMNTATDFARRSGVIRIVLSTQITNTPAQDLYVSLGYQKDENFYHYALSL
jgi:ribosomal protein S18 acetylase RimI-like enzyme